MQRMNRFIYDLHRFSTPQLLQQQYPHQYAYDASGGPDGCCEAQRNSQKKHSTTSLVNTRAYWPYPSAGAIAAASANGYGSLTTPVAVGMTTTTSECQSPGACSSSLEFEAMAAVHRLAVAVRDISVSEMLPRTSQLIFVNVTTLEGQPYCLELTAKGWRITSLRTDCMQGDFTRMELFTVYYESIYDLMSVISPSFKQHAAALASRRSRNSGGEDAGAEADSEMDGVDGVADYEDDVKSATISRQPSFTGLSASVSAAGSRRPSLKHSATEPHAIHLCLQCSCVSLVTPAGETMADVLMDTRPPSLLTPALPAPCRCGAQSTAAAEPEGMRFSRNKLRNIFEGCTKMDDDADLDTSPSGSSAGDLALDASSGGRAPSFRRASSADGDDRSSDASRSSPSTD